MATELGIIIAKKEAGKKTVAFNQMPSGYYAIVLKEMCKADEEAFIKAVAFVIAEKYNKRTAKNSGEES